MYRSVPLIYVTDNPTATVKSEAPAEDGVEEKMPDADETAAATPVQEEI